MRLLQFGLTFDEARIEQEFESFYTEAFAGYARGMLLLAVALLVADFLADLLLEKTLNLASNGLRIGLVLPIILATYALSARDWFRRRWQAYMSIAVVLTTSAVLIVLLRIDVAGGNGFSSMVGILNLTFALAFCFIVLGLQFRFAIVTGTAILLFFLYLLLRHSPAHADMGPYFAYHVVTLFLLLGSIGWMREKYIRRDFLATRAAEVEREKADRILYKILPRSIGERIKNGEFPIAEAHGEAAILFADLKGFTVLTSRMGPKHLVELLNQIFSGFDEISAEFGIEKIKTIGDAYMGVSGVPEYRDDHAVRAVHAAQRMIALVAQLAERRGLPISLRVGVHTGSVISGVIGTSKYHFDLWGDAVNIASRMESSGVPGRVQVSEATYWRTRDEFAYECRGEQEIRGKGVMTTYLL
jgi:adenylate cyclase